MRLRNWSNGFTSHKKQGLIGRHGFDDIARDRTVELGTHGHHQILQPLHAVLARHRQQPAFKQINLVLGQDESGTLLDQPAQQLKVFAFHAADLRA
jgi:hypothetical protein